MPREGLHTAGRKGISFLTQRRKAAKKDKGKRSPAWPWFSYICFRAGSESFVILNVGEEGWTVTTGGEIRKTIAGITISVRTDIPFT
jgi:hypothetical protein